MYERQMKWLRQIPRKKGVMHARARVAFIGDLFDRWRRPRMGYVRLLSRGNRKTVNTHEEGRVVHPRADLQSGAAACSEGWGKCSLKVTHACSTAQWPEELSENISQNLRNKLLPQSSKVLTKMWFLQNLSHMYAFVEDVLLHQKLLFPSFFIPILLC